MARLSHSRPSQFGRLPARRVQAGHFVEDGRRDVGAARRDLIALSGAGDVLHQQGEPARVGLHLGQIDRRHPGADAGGHLAVEADLDFVGPQGQAGAAALVVSRGELAHHVGRAGSGLVEGQGEPGRVRHLSRADRSRLEGAHRNALRQCAGLPEDAGQPLRGHVGGMAEERRHGHGRPRLGPGLVQRAVRPARRGRRPRRRRLRCARRGPAPRPDGSWIRCFRAR